jgi:Icc-related predicted phosphoesterase
MKIDYISDIHLDFHCTELNGQAPKFKKQLDKFVDTIKPNHHDVLIIAGDLGHYYSQDSKFLLKMKEFYKDVIVVPGNHDMYLVSKSIRSKYQYNSWNRILEMKKFCADNDIIYLDGNTKVINGVSFAGGGMAWDGSYGKKIEEDCTDEELLGHWELVMNDSRMMFANGKDNIRVPLAYSGYYTEPSFKPYEFFDSQKRKFDRIQNADVVVTHYGPKTPDDMREEYVDDLTTSFYYFDGEEYIDKLKPTKWIYGHSHIQVDEMHKGCNMLCNALGYPGENTYAEIKTFEIETFED